MYIKFTRNCIYIYPAGQYGVYGINTDTLIWSRKKYVITGLRVITYVNGNTGIYPAGQYWVYGINTDTLIWGCKKYVITSICVITYVNGN